MRLRPVFNEMSREELMRYIRRMEHRADQADYYIMELEAHIDFIQEYTDKVIQLMRDKQNYSCLNDVCWNMLRSLEEKYECELSDSESISCEEESC